jgi:hypothetical protein
MSASVKPFTEGVPFNGMNSDSPSWFSEFGYVAKNWSNELFS